MGAEFFFIHSLVRNKTSLNASRRMKLTNRVVG